MIKKQQREYVLGVRLSSDELARLTKQADRAAIPVSTYVRMLLFGGASLDGFAQQSGQKTPFLCSGPDSCAGSGEP